MTRKLYDLPPIENTSKQLNIEVWCDSLPDVQIAHFDREVPIILNTSHLHRIRNKVSDDEWIYYMNELLGGDYTVSEVKDYRHDLNYALLCIRKEYKIDRIKLCRALTGCGLKEAKDYVESLAN